MSQLPPSREAAHNFHRSLLALSSYAKAEINGARNFIGQLPSIEQMTRVEWLDKEWK